MIAALVGTDIGTVIGSILVLKYRAWQRRIAKRDKAKAGELGKL